MEHVSTRALPPGKSRAWQEMLRRRPYLNTGELIPRHPPPTQGLSLLPGQDESMGDLRSGIFSSDLAKMPMMSWKPLRISFNSMKNSFFVDRLSMFKLHFLRWLLHHELQLIRFFKYPQAFNMFQPSLDGGSLSSPSTESQESVFTTWDRHELWVYACGWA